MSPIVRQTYAVALDEFPQPVRPLLRQVLDRQGRIPAEQVLILCNRLALTPRKLALSLLPLAQALARAEVSGFRVGAVALAREVSEAKSHLPTDETGALFLGANLEFPGLPLHHTIHAEQSAVVNAWSGKAVRLMALAVSAPPCGACRQFLQEAVGAGGLEILLPARDGGAQGIGLDQLLPEAFGPQTLHNSETLFDRTPIRINNLKASGSPQQPNEPLCQAALMAAGQSYAPYTNNLAGCAILLANGHVVTGSNLESAAYNPGLTALQTALARANLTGAHLPEDIERAVLAERPSAVTQAGGAKYFFSNWAPAVELSIHRF